MKKQQSPKITTLVQTKSGQTPFFVAKSHLSDKQLNFFFWSGTYYISISSIQNILECATKVAHTVRLLRKGKELQNLTRNNCVQHLSRVPAL